MEGIIHTDIRAGCYNGTNFIEYVKSLLVIMNPWPEKHSVLVMDNCAIHHRPEVELLCEERCVLLVLSYSFYIN